MSIYILLHACGHTCMGAHAGGYACVWRPKVMLAITVNCSPTLFSESQANPVLSNLRLKLQEGQHNHVAFTRVLGIQTPVLTLVQKRLTTEPLPF